MITNASTLLESSFTIYPFLTPRIANALPYSGFFSRVKIFTNCPCPDFRGENFHESSIALSAYYIYLNVC